MNLEKSARSLYLTCLGLMFWLAFACKKDPPSPTGPAEPPRRYLTDQILEYIYQPLGTVMVYEDTLSGLLDTLTFTESRKDTTTWVLAQDPSIILYYEEALTLSWYRSSSKKTEWFYTTACLPHNNIFCINMYRIGSTEAPFSQFPWVVGDTFQTNSSSESTTTVQALYPVLNMRNATYTQVYCIKLVRDPTDALQDVDYYFARNIGVVAKIEYGTNRHWVLKTKM